MLAASPALQSPDGYLRQLERNLALVRERMLSVQNQTMHRHQQRYLSNAAKLDALSPLKVLTRGYAVVQTGEGGIVRSVQDATIGDTVSILLSDGSLTATITQPEGESL